MAPSSEPSQGCCLPKIAPEPVHAVSHTMPCASASTGLQPRSNAHRDPATRQSPAPLVLTTPACGAARCSICSHRPSPLQPVSQSVNQPVSYTFSSHLLLNRCLTLIIRVSNQHHIQIFTQKLGGIHTIFLAQGLYYRHTPVTSCISKKSP